LIDINYKMCKQCEIKPVYEFTNKRKVCKICFIRYFQKKFLYVVRKFCLIKKGEIVGYKHGGDINEVVLEDLLKLYVDKGFSEMVRLPSKKATKIALSDNLDSESSEIIHSLIEGDTSKLKNFSPTNGKEIKPLYLFSDKEILLYAKIRNLKFKVKKIKKDKITSFVDDLEKKHPEIKRAIINSYLELYG